MQQLIESFSIYEILLFAIILALACKGLIEFYDWARKRLKKVFDKEYNRKDKDEDIQERFDKDEERIKKLEDNQAKIINSLDMLELKVDMLIDSDKDAIKSFLTHEHHYYCYIQGWIDDYSLDCCEKRYTHYINEHGNSFIERFMEEIRALPNHPPLDDKENVDIN